MLHLRLVLIDPSNRLLIIITFYRSFILCSIVISSAVSRIRNSPIHFVKLTKYGNGIDYRSVRDLAKVFREKETNKEVDRSHMVLLNTHISQLG